MLEVGRVQEPTPGSFFTWNRAHFGAWCVVSAPLVLGLDVTNHDKVAAVVDIITNPEAIAVNQHWSGHPGGLVWSGLVGAGFPAARKCDLQNPSLKQAGWSLKPLAGGDVALGAPTGGCLAVQGRGFPGGAGGTVIAVCNATDPAQTFAYSTTTQQLRQPSSGHCVDVHSGGPIVWMYGCSSGPNDRFTLNKTTGTFSVAAGGGLCLGVEQSDPAGGAFEVQLQAWAKPLAAAVALLVINPDKSAHTVDFPVASLPLTGAGKNLSAAAIDVRDIWARAPLPAWPRGAATVKIAVGPSDSAFLLLS